MFMLPFITVLREGLEAVIYVGGVGLGLPASSFPLAVFCGLLAGFVVGYIIYRYDDVFLAFVIGGNTNTYHFIQRWTRDLNADLLDRFDLLPLPSGRRALLSWCLVL